MDELVLVLKYVVERSEHDVKVECRLKGVREMNYRVYFISS